MRLAKVKACGADEVADVFDKKQRPGCRGQIIDGVADHMRVKMTSLAGVDLDRRCAGGADAVGVIGGLLVAFDHGAGHISQHPEGLDKQRGLAGTGTGDKVEGKDTGVTKPPPVGQRIAVVPGHDIALQRNFARGRMMVFAVNGDLSFTATTSATHQITSSLLILSSSPRIISIGPAPQCGQGS